MGGGGGRTSTATAGIDPKQYPEVMEMLKASRDRTREQLSGKRDIVAPLTQQQRSALGSQEALAYDALHGRGIYDDSEIRKNAAKNTFGSMQNQSSAGKSLGSARSDMAAYRALHDLTDKQHDKRIAQARAGLTMLGDVGSTYHKAHQQGLDSQGMALDQFFNRINQGAQKTTTTTGGGK